MNIAFLTTLAEGVIHLLATNQKSTLDPAVANKSMGLVAALSGHLADIKAAGPEPGSSPAKVPLTAQDIALLFQEAVASGAIKLPAMTQIGPYVPGTAGQTIPASAFPVDLPITISGLAQTVTTLPGAPTTRTGVLSATGGNSGGGGQTAAALPIGTVSTGGQVDRS